MKKVKERDNDTTKLMKKVKERYNDTPKLMKKVKDRDNDTPKLMKIVKERDNDTPKLVTKVNERNPGSQKITKTMTFKRYKGFIRKWKYGGCFWSVKELDWSISSGSVSMLPWKQTHFG